MGDILFYSTDGPHGYMSNFSRHAVTDGDRVYPTSEHRFQAFKFRDAALHERVRTAPTPTVAAAIGRDRGLPRREDWEAVKELIMLDTLRLKFAQHPDLAARLVATAPRRLVEHTHRDRYWADGGDGTGLNRLGELLMTVHRELMDN